MRRSVALLVALGACGFQSPEAKTPPYCTDPNAVACYEFEGDTSDSSTNHLDATIVANVSFQPGMVGQAMQFGPTSVVLVPYNPAFDVIALTIEAWISPSQLPSGVQHAGILTTNGGYGFFLYPGGDLLCKGGIFLPMATAHVTIDRWTHVACTYDNAGGAIYADGVRLMKVTGSATLQTGSPDGISLAADNPPGTSSQLIGLIDEVRLMNVALTPEQICADAGKSSCP